MASIPGKMKNLISGDGERNEYTPVHLEEAAESRVSLSGRQVRGWYSDSTEPNGDVDAGVNVGLLNHERDGTVEADEKSRWKKNKRWPCANCIKGSTTSKIIGMVALLAIVFSAYKLLTWIFYKPPSGLEDLTVFGTSLGCHSAPYFYNNTQTITLDVPMHPHQFDHGIDFKGGAVGTITLTSTSSDSPHVQYEITIRSSDKALAQASVIKLPVQDEAGNMFSSMTTILTPYLPQDDPGSCLRYDVKMIIPPSLKKLHIDSHTLSHVKFDAKARIKLEDLFVTLFNTDQENIIQSSTSVKADRMSLQLTRGWLIGDVSIVDETNLITQRGDGLLHVNVYPEPPRDQKNPDKVSLDTATGAGRTKVFFHPNKGTKRPISATHVSARNGPMEFTYKGAGINGLVGVVAKEMTGNGIEKLDEAEIREDEQWNYYVGRKGGNDRISVNSRGWVGLYF